MAVTEKIDVVVDQGETWTFDTVAERDGSTIDLTGASAISQIRLNRDPSATDAVIAESTSSGGGIVFDNLTGLVRTTFSHEQTALLVANRVFYYDVLLIEASGVRSFLERGTIKQQTRVTRES